MNPLNSTYPNTTIYNRPFGFGGRNMTVLCEPAVFFRGAIPFLKTVTSHFPLMVVLFPMFLVTIFTHAFHLLLKPFGDAPFASQMLGGIAMGPSLLSKSKPLSQIIFPPKAIMVINVIECLGLIFMFFTLSARIDKGIVKKSGRLAIIIGVGAFIVPMLVSTSMALLIRKDLKLDDELSTSLPMIATLEATISFHVILAKLTELKLLNSDIGRLALSSSLLSSLISWFAPSLFIYSSDGATEGIKKRTVLLMTMSTFLLIIVIVFAIRPLILWMIKETPEGKPLKQEHLVSINVIVLVIAFVGELTGQNGYLGPFILGITTPVAPPMGSLLADKIQFFVWSAFMPCFMINTGRRVDLFSIHFKHFLVVEFIILIAGIVKTFVIVIPCLYSNIPFMDALALGLILNCRGVYDIQVFTRAKQRMQITDESFSIMVVTAMIQSAIVIPLVKLVYGSSRKYVAFRKRSIQNSESQPELRILACILEPDYVPTVINLLNASNPPESHVSIYVLNLEEYIGLSIPIVIPHRLDSKVPPSGSAAAPNKKKKPSKSVPIINAFIRYQETNKAYVSVQCFTGIAPYPSMHDDVCSMAFQKSTSFIIFPFQKHDPTLTKKVINKVLLLSPCSVGLLYDHCLATDYRSFSNHRVVVLFIGGPDDCEALAFGARMGRNPGVMLTVIRFIAKNNHITSGFITDDDWDQAMVNEFRMNSEDGKNIQYIEEVVNEGSDTMKIINSIGNDYDLFLVGRRHDDGLHALQGLGEWIEIQELGVVGDLLASHDFKSKASVMVIQY